MRIHFATSATAALAVLSVAAVAATVVPEVDTTTGALSPPALEARIAGAYADSTNALVWAKSYADSQIAVHVGPLANTNSLNTKVAAAILAGQQAAGSSSAVVRAQVQGDIAASNAVVLGQAQAAIAASNAVAVAQAASDAAGLYQPIGAYLTAEADPYALPRLALLEGRSNVWNTAYSWGDHSLVGYLTAEVDPVWAGVSNSVAGNALKGATAYGWGDHSLVGYLTAPSIAGLVSKTYADTLMATGTAYAVSGPQSNALASALQPSWATTGTVSRAQMADMLKSPSGRTWLEVANGNTYIVEVTNSTSVYVVSTEGEGYNGPAAGTVWSGPPTFDEETNDTTWPNTDAWMLYYQGNNQEWTLWNGATGWNYYPTDMVLPLTLGYAQSDVAPIGFPTLDWVPVTNTYQVATQEGTVALIGNHDADPDAHPTLARTNALAGYTTFAQTTGIVDSAVSVAIAPLLPRLGDSIAAAWTNSELRIYEPVGDGGLYSSFDHDGVWARAGSTTTLYGGGSVYSTTGADTVQWLWGDGVRAAGQYQVAAVSDLAGYVATNAIPGPGCTDISAGGVVAGATAAHWFSSATNYTLSVSKSAPRYTYSIEVLSTNAATFAEGIELRGAWTPSGTNLVVIAPSTGTLWRAYGRAF